MLWGRLGDTWGRGDTGFALQPVLFESPDRGFPQRVVVSNGAGAEAGLEARAFGQREGVVAGQGRDACGG